MNNGIIYKVTSPNGKIYIGQTIFPLDKRKKVHERKAFKSEECTKFLQAIRKFKDSLSWEILEKDVPENLLDQLEIYYINLYDSYKNGYNSTMGGESTRGISLCERTREKISKATTGIKNPFYGKRHSEEFKLKLSKNRIGSKNPFYGRKNDKHHLAKLNWDTVDSIRREFNGAKISNIKLTHKEIAKRYNISRSVVTNIVNYKKWIK